MPWPASLSNKFWRCQEVKAAVNYAKQKARSEKRPKEQKHIWYKKKPTSLEGQDVIQTENEQQKVSSGQQTEIEQHNQVS